MNNLLKGSIIFVAGAALGVGCSYKYFETKYSKIADEEIESVKLAIRNRQMKEAVKNGMDVDGDIVVIRDGDGNIVDKRYVNISTGEDRVLEETKEEIKEAHKSYNEISAAYKSKVAESMSREPKEKVNYAAMSNKEVEQTNRPVNNINKLKPIVISSKSYVEDCTDYDKLTLHYYALDGVVLDDNDDVFEDFEDYIGHDALEQFGAFDVGDNLVYVRNDKWESDYEIIKLDEAYM